MSKAALSPVILRKTPTEVVVINLSYKPKMVTTETISTFVVTDLTPPTDLTVTVKGWGGQNGQVTISAGTAAVDYSFIGTATTSKGQTLQIKSRVFVRAE